MSTRILVVEDDPGTQDLIRALCESRGDSVDTASDGFLGLRLLSERRHEVVLIDYHLPEMDGYALARLMREIARPEKPIRLVGVTGDSHGLALRRGADTLFDAILVKPLEPAVLFATLDRVTAPEPPAPAPQETDPADALWRRRGLPGRPRALVCPDPSPGEAEAVGQAFAITASADEAEVVLVTGEAGLEHLRALRGDGPAALVPAIDLTGRLGAACDAVFQVGDPGSWSALAQTCRDFDRRRAELTLAVRTHPDPGQRLLALLCVADRRLSLGPSGAHAYETGLSSTVLMAAVLSLTEHGLLACEPVAEGVAVRVTEAGRRSVSANAVTELPAAEPTSALAKTAVSQWQTPRALETSRPVPDPPATEPLAPIVNPRKVAELRALVGHDQILRLNARLMEVLATAFAPDLDDATLAQQAHVLISLAGSLGFERLSEACRSLQTAYAAGGDVPRCLGEAKRAAEDVAGLCRPVAAGTAMRA